MKKAKCAVLAIFVLIMTISFVLIWPSDSPAAGKEKWVTVGAVFPLTGPVSIVGVSAARGVEMAFAKINDEGGVKVGDTTYKFKVVKDDSKLTFEAAASATRKQVLQDKAIMVFGDFYAPSSEGIYSVTSKYKKLQVVNWVQSPGDSADVSVKKPLLLRPQVNQTDMTAVYIQQLHKLYPEVKFLINVSPAREDFALLNKTTTEDAIKQGLKIETVTYEFGTEDFIPVMTKVLAMKPDALLMQSTPQATPIMAARQLEFKGPILSVSPLPAEEIVRIVGPKLATNILSCANPEDPSVQEMQVIWTKLYGSKEPFIADAINAYNQGLNMAEVIKKAQSLDPAKLVATFESMTAPGSFKTSWGPGRAGGKDTVGVNRRMVRAIPMARTVDGKIEYMGLFPCPYN
jgi:branched-chain amino acid transport system substrate-binding protein